MTELNYQEKVIKPSLELLASAVENGHIGLVKSLMEVLNTPVEDARKMLSLLLPQVEAREAV